MALKTKLTTINGIELAAAILVITALNDSRTDNYQYQAVPSSQGSKSGKLFESAERDEPRRHSQFQVSIYANEDILKEGKPAIGLLFNQETGLPSFSFEIDDKSELDRIEQAYENLQKLYPGAKFFDGAALGLT